MGKINAFIREKRERLGAKKYSQKYVAEQLQLSEKQYQRYEKDDFIPPKTLKEIARVLEINEKEAFVVFISDYTDVQDILSLVSKDYHPMTVEDLHPLEGVGGYAAVIKAVVKELAELQAFVYKDDTPENYRNKLLVKSEEALDRAMKEK